MKRIIFSLYRDDLDEHTSVGPEKREAFIKYADQLSEVKSTYANHIGAEYKLFTPDSTAYDDVQFQKLTMFEELAKDYDEILLLGSGKGVTSVKSINEIRWKRKSLKKFNFLSKQYDLIIKNCKSYRLLANERSK